MKIDQYQTAIDHYQKAEKKALERRDKGKNAKLTEFRLGNTYQNIHRYQTAVGCYQKAHEIALQREDVRQERKAYLRIGYIYLMLGEDERAIECYRKAERVALKRGGKMQEEEDEAISLSNRLQNVAGEACIHEYLDVSARIKSFVRSFV